MKRLFKRKAREVIRDLEPVTDIREKRKKRREKLKGIPEPTIFKLNSTITDKKKDMKFLKPAGKIALSIIKGFADVLFPNLNNTIKMKESDFKNEPGKKWEIDFPRLLAAVTVWIILLLVFFGKVKFEDVIEIIGRLL